MDKTGRDRLEWIKRLWRERRPFVVSMIILIVGLPIVITLGEMNDEPKNNPAVDKTISQALEATEEGDYDAAYRALKAAEDQAVSKEQKAVYYLELSAAAANTGKLDEAISYLKLRQQVDPSTAGSSSELLGTLYERKGDKANALAQYKLALEYYESQPEDLDRNIRVENLKAVIAALEAGNE